MLASAAVRVLITGATGFAGRHLSSYCASLGHEVHAVVRAGREGALVPGVVPHVADIGDAGALAAAIETLIDDADERDRCRRRLLETAEQFRWPRVVGPLAGFCRAPRLAPDRSSVQRAHHVRVADSFRVVRWVKRRALALGVSHARLNQIKGLTPVRVVIGWVNRLAMAYDRGPVAARRSSGTEKN